MGPDQIYDSVIVGAGLSGLVAGYELAAAGAAMCILEANDHPGGRVRTIRYGPIYAEAGGMIVTDEDTAALQLCRSDYPHPGDVTGRKCFWGIRSSG
jgi:monoamine oxidase